MLIVIACLLLVAGQLPAQQAQRDRGLDLRTEMAGSATEVHIEFGPGEGLAEARLDNGAAQLARVVEMVGSPGWRHRTLVVEGHTCGCRRAGEDEGIAHQRAAVVRDYLVEAGAVAREVVYLRPFPRAELADAATRQDLSPEMCAADEVHAMDRRVTVRELSADDLEPPVRLIKPTPEALLAQASMWYRPRAERGRFRRLLNDTTLRSGDQISVFLTAAQPLHAYVFHLGSGGGWTCLFPNPAFSLDAPARNPIEPGRKYWLPRFGAGVPLDDTPGVEETFVRLSASPDPRLEQWVREGVPHLTTQTADGMVQARPDTGGIEWHARVRFVHEAAR